MIIKWPIELRAKNVCTHSVSWMLHSSKNIERCLDRPQFGWEKLLEKNI